MRVSREPHRVIASCLSLYVSHRTSAPVMSDETMVMAIRRGLRHFFEGLVTIHESLYPGWEADKKHPGYLVRVDYPATVRAPYHLVPAFPTEDALNGIWQLSRKIRAAEDSLLCLSGSAAVLKSSVIIGDFDFCEYVRVSSEGIASSLLSKATYTEPVVLKKIRLGGLSWSGSYPELEVHDAVASLDPSDADRSHGKIDFFGKARGFRPGEISNMLIFCSDDLVSAARQKTFALQEAHIDATVFVPSELDDPYEMGRYVYWLRGNAKEYLKAGNYPKSLKRCLSLARVCFLSDLADDISSYIETSPEFLKRELDEVAELESIFAADPEKYGPWMRDLNEARIDTQFRLNKLERVVTPNRVPIAEFVGNVLDQLADAVEGRDRAA